MQIQMFSAMFAKTIWMFKPWKPLSTRIPIWPKICLEDDEVDRVERHPHRMEEIIMRDPAQQVYLAKLISVARSMERIADHCTNICEDIIYMAQGKIVRHHIMR